MHARQDYRYFFEINTILISTLVLITALLWKKVIMDTFIRVFGTENNLGPLVLLTGTITVGTVLASVHLWHKSYHCKHSIKQACVDEQHE